MKWILGDRNCLLIVRGINIASAARHYETIVNLYHGNRVNRIYQESASLGARSREGKFSLALRLMLTGVETSIGLSGLCLAWAEIWFLRQVSVQDNQSKQSRTLQVKITAPDNTC